MLSREFLIERVLNLHTLDEKSKYIDAVWDLLQKSYKKIGGFKTATDKQELLSFPGYWKVVKRGDTITAVRIYRKSPKTTNYKTIAGATETEIDARTGANKATKQGMSDYTMLGRADIEMQRSWAEVSGPAEIIMKRMGATPVPNKYAAFLTDKDITELNPDGYHYTRAIQGHPHEKVIYGVPKLSPEMKKELENKGLDIHDFPTK